MQAASTRSSTSSQILYLSTIHVQVWSTADTPTRRKFRPAESRSFCSPAKVFKLKISRITVLFCVLRRGLPSGHKLRNFSFQLLDGE